MAKWADYLISKVEFNTPETHIVKVEAYTDTGDKLGAMAELTRQTVIALIDKGYTFSTIFQNSDGTWREGARVITITIDGVRFERIALKRTTWTTYRDSRSRPLQDRQLGKGTQLVVY